MSEVRWQLIRKRSKLKYGNIPPDILQQVQDRDTMIAQLSNDLRTLMDGICFMKSACGSLIRWK